MPEKSALSQNSPLFCAIQLLFLSLLAVSILHSPADACGLAALALKLWFEKMIPSLFPFMVLSGLIVRLDLGKTISLPVYPILGRLYRISRTMCTTLLLGFLFGFPLGAKTVAEQYSLKQLTKPQAQYLLSFCNNIGPVYLLSFALPLLGLSGDSENHLLRLALTAGFFGIPLLYGMILRYTVYRSVSFSAECLPVHIPDKAPASLSAASTPEIKTSVPQPSALYRKPRKMSASLDIASVRSQRPSFIFALDLSVTSACSAITRLGGYMVFFMVCNLIPRQISHLLETLFPQISPGSLAALTAPVLEITSGLSLAKDILSPALSMTMLTFGGLSCFAQTYTCIRETDLSFGNYCLHKLFQSAIAFCFYTVILSAFSSFSSLSVFSASSAISLLR